MSKTKHIGALLLSAGAIAGCSNSSSSPEPCSHCNAVVTLVDFGFNSSSIGLSDAFAPYDLVEGYADQDLSDIGAVTHGNYFYRLGRSGQHNVTKFSFDDPNSAEWQFSVGNDSNPNDMVFLSEEKAYVIRYGSGSIWVVNPSVSAAQEEDFKIGEIDLSAYDPDGIPNMKAAAIVDGKLYVTMQVLDEAWVPGQAYVAVIDTATDEEIDVDGDTTNGLPGIPLAIENPLDLDVLNDDIYVTGIGPYYPITYTGGIERIDTATYETELVVDDNEETTQIDKSTIVNDTTGYFVAYAGWQNTSLVRFNPTTGEVAEVIEGTEEFDEEVVTLADISGVDITSIEVSPEGYVWVGVGDSENPKIHLLDPDTDTVVETILTTMNATGIVFSD